MGAGFKDFTSSPLSSDDVDNYLMKQTTIPCLSSARPVAPEPGMRIYETDTDTFRYWNGTQWAYDQTMVWPFFRQSDNDSDSIPATDPRSFADIIAGSVPNLQAGLVIVDLQLTMSSAVAQAANVRVTTQVAGGSQVGLTENGSPPADLSPGRTPYRYLFRYQHPGGTCTFRASVQANAAGGSISKSGSLMLVTLPR